ncbi:MAG: hypothetical protein ACXVYY_13760 [Oryzihumus sp.]
MTTVALTNPDSLLVAHTSNAEGSLIDDLRGECGVILQTIDWIARKLGFDLIGAIFDPIAGDFSTVDAMRQDWLGVAGALKAIGENYQAMAGALPRVWDAGSAERAVARLRSMGEAHATQAKAAELMSQQLGNMLTAVSEGCKLLAGVLGLVEEIVLSMSIAKWAEEILTMGSGVRKVVSLLYRAIEFIKNLSKVIPPMLKAAGILATMFKYMNLAFMMPVAAVAQGQAALHADDTAAAGFHSPAFAPGSTF